MNAHVVGAIFKRNFFAYFNNPTGYVFICMFVLLSSFAAFWPNDFFNANLDNLDQLNKYLPYILLVFIPAITMSIWAEERRQGTDELLLTIPATDLDVVVGKYLGALAIYSVALGFSLVCNYLVLEWLGNPDLGLFVATYIGYWMVGLAMLSIGMVASFLTGNLTVGFVLGVAFNAPLAFATSADVIFPAGSAAAVSSWSLSEQFRDFGRGVISLPSVVYFGTITLVMLYLSMVLISRRHWQGRSAEAMGAHYLVRTISLAVLAVALVSLSARTGARADISSERLSSLSPRTVELVRKLDPKNTINIDAYISPEVPEAYVQTRLNLLSALREFKALGSRKLFVEIHDTEPLSDEAEQAEKQFNITARQVFSRSRGAMKAEEIYMGVAFTSGVNKVVVPYFDFGTPIEYELARSIATVAQSKRKTIGVVATDAKLFGGFDQATFSPTANQPIVDELEKQYEVKQVNLDAPLTEKYDVLLAVQPSSLGPQQMEHFIAAVESGQPTAIFEDPFPMDQSVPGTAAPKMPQQQNPFMQMGGRQNAGPKGDIGKLFRDLGVDFSADSVVWQRYNPYPRLAYLPDECVFIDHGASRHDVFNGKDPITSGLQEMIFLFPGSIRALNAGGLSIKPLMMTGENTGTVGTEDIMQRSMFGRGGLNPHRRLIPRREEYVLAVRIEGTLKSSGAIPMSDKPADAAAPAAAPPATAPAPATPAAPEKKVDVVLVADIDLMYRDFFDLRNNAGDPNRGDINLNPDNVTFVLNVLDSLAHDDRFIDIRKRRPAHRTLQKVEQVTEGSRQEALANRAKFNAEFEEAKARIEADFRKELEAIKNRKDINPQQLLIEIQMVQENQNRRLQTRIAQLQKERDRKTAEIERQLALQVRGVQNRYKMWAVFLPPIPPLLIGLAVFFNRRAGEREGVARSRLR